MSNHTGPSHADACPRLAGTGPCSCCPSCNTFRFAAADGRCLTCFPELTAPGVQVTPSTPRVRSKPEPTEAPVPTVDGTLFATPMPTEQELVRGLVLACTDCGAFEASDGVVLMRHCDCGKHVSRIGARLLARKLYGTPLDPGMYDPEAEGLKGGATMHQAGESPAKAAQPAPGEIATGDPAPAPAADDFDDLEFDMVAPPVAHAAFEGAVRDALATDRMVVTTLDDRGPHVVVPRAPVSHAADPATLVAETPGIVGNASPPTSHAAAGAVLTGKRRIQVLEALAGTGLHGATAEELEALAGVSGSTVRPRLLELERDGFVERTAMNRPTNSGMLAVVYASTARGRAALERINPRPRPHGMP